MTYAFLFTAIVLEVIGTSALKASEQFTKLLPIIVMVVCYGTSFFFLSLVLRTLPVGIAYAIWSGLGIVLVTFPDDAGRPVSARRVTSVSLGGRTAGVRPWRTRYTVFLLSQHIAESRRGSPWRLDVVAGRSRAVGSRPEGSWAGSQCPRSSPRRPRTPSTLPRTGSTWRRTSARHAWSPCRARATRWAGRCPGRRPTRCSSTSARSAPPNAGVRPGGPDTRCHLGDRHCGRSGPGRLVDLPWKTPRGAPPLPDRTP